MEKSGVYKIVNTLNNKVYIGSSVNIKSRKYSHFEQLSLNNHHSSHLQRAYNKYGKENFKLEIIECVEKLADIEIFKRILLTREQYWINLFKSYDRNFGYNISPTAGSPLGVKQTEETRRKVGLASLGRSTKKVLNTDTGEVFNSITEAARTYNISNSKIGEVCNGIRKTTAGFKWEFLTDTDKVIEHRIHTEEFKNKISTHNRGKKLAEEHRLKIKETRNRLRKRVVNITTGEVFCSLSEAAKVYNIDSSAIGYACRGTKRKTAGGCYWSFIGDEK